MSKRVFDALSASILLLLLLPLLAAAVIVVKLDSEGPAFFRQDRVGRKGRRFQIFKLRTMAVRSSGSAYTLGADSRITRSGRWLRRTKIDELPQLWNVIRGDMSMVGPRPVIPELAMEFDWAYERLLSVRPGLTDPASLRYCNECEILECVPEADRYFKTVVTPDKIRISSAYLQRATLWRDLIVILQTALALTSWPMRRCYYIMAGTAQELIKSQGAQRLRDHGMDWYGRGAARGFSTSRFWFKRGQSGPRHESAP